MKWTLEPGQDFRDQILKGLEEAGFFVGLISRASLGSIWRQFEADQRTIPADVREDGRSPGDHY